MVETWRIVVGTGGVRRGWGLRMGMARQGESENVRWRWQQIFFSIVLRGRAQEGRSSWRGGLGWSGAQ